MISQSISSQIRTAAFQNAVQTAFLNNPMQAMQALQSLNQSLAMQGMNQGAAWQDFSGTAPQTSLLPAPEQGLSGPPAGKGLSKDPQGFPKGSIRTAGGYTIVPEGNTNWSIYAPGQKSTAEKPHTRIWGDPHVTEKDGTRWDFTRSSDFVLPDGTRIHCKTSSETGQSVSKGLTISNGADRVDVTGVDGKPTTGAITPDGYEWRAQHLASKQNLETFRLGGDDSKVHWFKEKGGQDLGLITGAKKVGNSYEQVTDGKQGYWVNDGLRPAIGSAAWGNQFRGELADFMAQQVLPPPIASLFGQFMHANHRQVEEEQHLLGLGLPVGGLTPHFGSWAQVQDAIVDLGDRLLEQQGFQNHLMAGRAGQLFA